jgi:hypothetical protein
MLRPWVLQAARARRAAAAPFVAAAAEAAWAQAVVLRLLAGVVLVADC